MWCRFLWLAPSGRLKKWLGQRGGDWGCNGCPTLSWFFLLKLWGLLQSTTRIHRRRRWWNKILILGRWTALVRGVLANSTCLLKWKQNFPYLNSQSWYLFSVILSFKIFCFRLFFFSHLISRKYCNFLESSHHRVSPVHRLSPILKLATYFIDLGNLSPFYLFFSWKIKICNLQSLAVNSCELKWAAISLSPGEYRKRTVNLFFDREFI